MFIFIGALFSCQSLEKSIRRAENAIGAAKKIGSDEYAKSEIGEAMHLLDKALVEEQKKIAIQNANGAESRANDAYHQTLKKFIIESLIYLNNLKKEAIAEHADTLEKEGFTLTGKHHHDVISLGTKLESWVLKIFGAEREVLDAMLKLELESEATIFLEEVNSVMDEYEEVIQLAKNQTAAILQKLNVLEIAIKKATNNPDVNQNSVAKASSLHKQAKEDINNVDYVSAENKIENALRGITHLPIVKFQLEPAIFSPDGDGYHDNVIFTSSIDAPNKIVSWEIKIFDKISGITKRSTKKKDSSMIRVKHFSGKGLPPKTLNWNGKLDGNVYVASAKKYLVELSVKDDKDGIGYSTLIDLKTDVFVVPTSRGLLIDIPSIQFTLNSAKLDSRYYSVLTKVYKKVLDYPGTSLVVEGHTDFLGGAKHNFELSKQRAVSVMRYLQKKGITQSKIDIKGLGEALPKYLEEEKAPLNRRVSFILLRNNTDKKKYEDFLSDLESEKEFKYLQLEKE